MLVDLENEFRDLVPWIWIPDLLSAGIIYPPFADSVRSTEKIDSPSGKAGDPSPNPRSKLPFRVEIHADPGCRIMN